MKLILTLILATASMLQAAPEVATKNKGGLGGDAPAGKLYTYKESAGKPRQMEIYFPPNHDPSKAKVPGLILFHGGGWGGGTLAQFRVACAYFASRGLVCAAAEYQMLSAADAKKLPAGETRKRVCVTDAKSAIRWFKQHAIELGIDPNRIITGGGSAGGHISALATLNPGLNDPADPKDIDTSVVAYLWFNPAFALDDDQDAEIDVLRYVKPGLAPAIVFFGDQDNWKKGWDIAQAKWKSLGKQTIDLQIAPGQSHSFFNKDPWQTLTLIAADRFLVKLGLLTGEPTKPAPAGREKLIPADGKVTSHSQGLHGYIGFGHEQLPTAGGYTAGMGFYAAVWPLTDQPLADFQIGLPSTWIQPDNSDNKDQPLAPEGTLARQWKERGPTWSTVFQTVEGGLGYWARNHFRYGPPKFSMNATPQCYDYEVGSPGWSFFYSNEALPDNRLGIAQLSNRLLIPPDGLPFQGQPNGEFLGYTWMALPFTDPTTGDPPTGDQSWTCFLSAANFKGPIAYYIPETWSKIGKLFNEPFLHGRGLDARPGKIGGGAMEINTVPRFDATDAQGTTYSKLPKLQFPVDAEGRAFLVQDVTYYSKSALYDAFKSWRDGGPTCSGRMDAKGAFKPKLNTHTTRYNQAGQKIIGVERAFDTRIFDGNVWGLQWSTNDLAAKGLFPQYYQQVGAERVAVPAAAVPAETKLLTQEFKRAKMGAPYTSPSGGAWATPGPKLGPFTARLVDGSVVTYSWYRFVDQPSFQQYQWSEEKKAKLQALVEKLHAHWTLNRDHMAPPTRGKLVALDPALLVTPPPGLEVGYVPIVTRQAAKN